MANPSMMALHLAICAASFAFARKMHDKDFVERLGKEDVRMGLDKGAPVDAPEPLPTAHPINNGASAERAH